MSATKQVKATVGGVRPELRFDLAGPSLNKATNEELFPRTPFRDSDLPSGPLKAYFPSARRCVQNRPPPRNQPLDGSSPREAVGRSFQQEYTNLKNWAAGTDTLQIARVISNADRGTRRGPLTDKENAIWQIAT